MWPPTSDVVDPDGNHAHDCGGCSSTGACPPGEQLECDVIQQDLVVADGQPSGPNGGHNHTINNVSYNGSSVPSASSSTVVGNDLSISTSHNVNVTDETSSTLRVQNSSVAWGNIKCRHFATGSAFITGACGTSQGECEGTSNSSHINLDGINCDNITVNNSRQYGSYVNEMTPDSGVNDNNSPYVHNHGTAQLGVHQTNVNFTNQSVSSSSHNHDITHNHNNSIDGIGDHGHDLGGTIVVDPVTQQAHAHDFSCDCVPTPGFRKTRQATGETGLHVHNVDQTFTTANTDFSCRLVCNGVTIISVKK